MALAVDAVALAACLDLLDTDERSRANRFGHAAARCAFVVTRARLRQLIGETLGIGHRTLSFIDGPAGKPALRHHSGLHFSVAHAGEAALIAISRAGPLGVDIEQEQDVPEMADIAAALFDPAARKILASAPPGERRAAFLRLWTCREALVKATGTGLADAATRIDPTIWAVAPIPAPAGYAAALAHPRGAHALLLHA